MAAFGRWRAARTPAPASPCAARPNAWSAKPRASSRHADGRRDFPSARIAGSNAGRMTDPHRYPGRIEDEPLLRGQGRFMDDAHAADAALGWFVRAPHAAARIRRIDVAAARAVPGVLAVLTAPDLDAAGVGNLARALPLTRRDGTP